jgi:hypothetical protein
MAGKAKLTWSEKFKQIRRRITVLEREDQIRTLFSPAAAVELHAVRDCIP